MFSQNERDLLKISRALINLHGFFIVLDNNVVEDNPIIMVDLLTKVELETFKTLLSVKANEKIDIENNIVENKFLSVLGSSNNINLDFTPAGIINYIAEAIVKKSEEYLENENNSIYHETEQAVNYIETMGAIISYYLNTPYETVISLPINEIYKRYAICQSAFPNQVQPLINEVDEVEKR